MVISRTNRIVVGMLSMSSRMPPYMAMLATRNPADAMYFITLVATFWKNPRRILRPLSGSMPMSRKIGLKAMRIMEEMK